MEEGDKISKPDFVKWFSELNKSSGAIAGGKGANLAEIFNLGVPVPPGFMVTAQAYDYFIKTTGLWDRIQNLLNGLDYENTQQLDNVTSQIRELIMNEEFPEEMNEEITEAYEHLGASEYDQETGNALDVLNFTHEPVFVAVRSSATAEDLADASFAGQQDTYLNVKGSHSLLKNVKQCIASLFTSRATYYRNKNGFEHEKVSLAVVVQKMINSDKSGVIFSKDPAYKGNNVIMEAVWGLGEGIVSGRITPDKYVVSNDLEILDKKVSEKKIVMTRDSSGKGVTKQLSEEVSKAQVLSNIEVKSLAEYALKLEEHYGKPQDIEFAIEDGEIFIVQTRPITTMETRQEKGQSIEIKGDVILEGLAASPGIAVGVVKIIKDLADLNKIEKGDVLVTGMTNPDMVVTMQKSSAIITDEGGLTAHAAIVSREMGIPCIVGTGDATEKLRDGEIITIDGYNGKVYRGKVAEAQKKEVLPVTVKTKTHLKVIVDLPTFAERASKTNLDSVGLTRLEGIIAESGKHPNYYLTHGNVDEYEEVIYKGISGIAKYFNEIWVRTSDVRTDEYQNLEGAPKEIEANPMLGMHGVRFSVKNPKLLKAELKGLMRVSREGKKVGLLLPQVISVDEVQQVKQALNDIGFNDAKVGVMVETPAAVQLIKELCEEGIDFISFGTNDLTQYILAIDRGNEGVQHLYNEMHPAVLKQLEFVIRICRKNNVESSICGQAGSRKEMVKFLVERGIDSISVNADVAKEISEYIYSLEQEVLGRKGELPRQYQPEVKPVVTSPVQEEKPFVQTISQETPEQIEKNVEAIEAEKKEVCGTEQVISISEDEEIPSGNLEVAPEVKELVNEEVQEEVIESEMVPEEIVQDETPIIESVSEQTPEQIDKDIEAIEEEKREYENSQNIEIKEEISEPEVEQNLETNERVEWRAEEESLPSINGLDSLEPVEVEEIPQDNSLPMINGLDSLPPQEENIEDDIKAIEEEKEEYLEDHPEEVEIIEEDKNNMNIFG